MPKGTDRLPGQLAINPAYLEWYHRDVKGQTLCPKILGRMISGGKDNIAPKEEITSLGLLQQKRFTGC